MRIPNSLVSPNDFRKRFKLFFTDDLVESYTDENKASEHLI
jgi:hypothetical protein